MCVIIIIPQGEQISKNELKKAWNTNSDGAGFAYQDHGTGTVKYSRGFMQFKDLYKAIKPVIGSTNIVLHFRISTSNAVNKLQCHPYELGNKYQLTGTTTKPVICMNGVIYGQVEYKGLNDTMSYIQDNQDAFQIIADTASLELLDIVQEATGSRWAIITPENLLFSSDFEYYQGRYYSNKNHLKTTYKTYYCCSSSTDPTEEPEDILQDNLMPKLYKKLTQNPKLYNQTKDYFTNKPYKAYLLYWCDTLADIRELINTGGLYDMLY